MDRNLDRMQIVERGGGVKNWGRRSREKKVSGWARWIQGGREEI